MRGAIRVYASGLVGWFRLLRRPIDDVRRETKWWCTGSKGNPDGLRVNFSIPHRPKAPVALRAYPSPCMPD
jgi:hypothetical protein